MIAIPATDAAQRRWLCGAAKTAKARPTRAKVAKQVQVQRVAKVAKEVKSKVTAKAPSKETVTLCISNPVVVW